MDKAVLEIQAKMKTWTDAGIELAYNSGYEQGCEDQAEKADLDYKDGLEDGRTEAWECAKKLILNKKDGGLSTDEIKDIFAADAEDYTVFKNLSASEAIEKIKKYEGGVTRQSIIKSQLEDIITGFTEPVTSQEIIDALVQIKEKAND